MKVSRKELIKLIERVYTDLGEIGDSKAEAIRKRIDEVMEKEF